MIDINKAQLNDANAINNILKLAFKNSYEKYKFCPAYEATDNQIISWMNRSYVYKIALNDEIIGSAFIQKTGEYEYELNTITVHPKCQNMGIGTKAINFIEEIHSDALIWTLQTPEKDYWNRHLYKKVGYTVVGEQKINEFLTLINYKKCIQKILV